MKHYSKYFCDSIMLFSFYFESLLVSLLCNSAGLIVGENTPILLLCSQNVESININTETFFKF